MDRDEGRQTLTRAVAEQVICERTGVVLDVRSAVLLTARKDGRTASEVLDGAVWDEHGARVAELFQAENTGLEVLDGRVLYST